MNFTFKLPFKNILLEYSSPPSWSYLRFMLPRNCRWMFSLKPCKDNREAHKNPSLDTVCTVRWAAGSTPAFPFYTRNCQVMCSPLGIKSPYYRLCGSEWE